MTTTDYTRYLETNLLNLLEGRHDPHATQIRTTITQQQTQDRQRPRPTGGLSIALSQNDQQQLATDPILTQLVHNHSPHITDPGPIALAILNNHRLRKMINKYHIRNGHGTTLPKLHDTCTHLATTHNQLVTNYRNKLGLDTTDGWLQRELAQDNQETQPLSNEEIK